MKKLPVVAALVLIKLYQTAICLKSKVTFFKKEISFDCITASSMSADSH